MRLLKQPEKLYRTDTENKSTHIMFLFTFYVHSKLTYQDFEKNTRIPTDA